MYLDTFMPPFDRDDLNLEICQGIAISEWNKKFVSSGVHDDWSSEEITPTMKSYKTLLSTKEAEVFENLKTTDERIKFMTCMTTVPHPFWVIFLRNNKRIEPTGIQNKAIGSDCSWTENAKYFPKLVQFINKMPFTEIGRVIFFMTEANNKTVPHFDAGSQEQRMLKGNDDFVWFTTMKNPKSVFVMDGDTKQKYYADPTKQFIFFNEMDYHGTDAIDHFGFSIRVEGKFKKHVKDYINGD